MKITKAYLNDLTYTVIGAAIEVHKEFGPGLLERVYERCLKYELEQQGIEVKSQCYFPVLYKGENLDAGLKVDLLVENELIVELKVVEYLIPLFNAQLLTYMKLLKKPKGLLINFNSTNIAHNGQHTLVNDFFAQLPEE